MIMGLKGFCIVDDIVKSKNFKTFYEYLEYTEYNTIALFGGAVCICDPQICNLKYKHIKDLRFVCDLVFKKDYWIDGFEMTGYKVFINITEYIKDAGWYSVEDDGVYNYDEADYEYDIEQPTREYTCEFIDEPDEKPTVNCEYDFIDTDTEESEDYEGFIPDDFVDHNFMS